MAWSSFAHLPGKKEEYVEVLSFIKEGMTKEEVDQRMAEFKGKQRVSHHYRNNLVNLGIIDIKDNKVHLNYQMEKIKTSDTYLSDVLLHSILNKQIPEILLIDQIMRKKNTGDLDFIISELRDMHPSLSKDNCRRWIRPIVVLLKITGPLLIQDSKYSELLDRTYMKLAKEYGKNIAIARMDYELTKSGQEHSITDIISNILNCQEYRFRIELLMLPSWATKQRPYIINNNMYTHIKLKGELR